MSNLKAWQADVDDVVKRLPCFLSRITRPRVVILPKWWPFKYGAWTYFNWILVTPGVSEAPKPVRQYIIGHEYGHIRHNHNVLQYIYCIGGILWIIGVLMNLPILMMCGALVIILCLFPVMIPYVAHRIEYAADDVAVEIWGRNTALFGSLWMAKQSGTLQNKLRRLRLLRLGWNDRT